MQILRRKRCQTRTRPRISACVYGAVVSGSTVQVFDAETGLNQNWMRDYDPRLGRYRQSDPIGLAGGINTYAYANGAPLKYVDFLGLSPIGSIVKLLDNGGRIIGKAIYDIADAVAARLSGESVEMNTRQAAKQVETAAYGSTDLMRHKGHELPDGSTGSPHYQTDGKYGHSFWGKQKGSVDPSLLEIFLPWGITPNEISPGTLWGPGTPFASPQAFDKAIGAKACVRIAPNI